MSRSSSAARDSSTRRSAPGRACCWAWRRALIVVAHLLPLWNLTMFAPQYPDGLRLDIYSHTLVGGHDGQDIKEINLLNHYIGMHDLAVEDFTEFKWMPFVLGGLALLFLRAVVLGTVKELRRRDRACSSTSARSRSGRSATSSIGYGHDLSPTAAVKVPAFMPPMFGYQQIANFEVYSYPQAGTLRAWPASSLLLLAALWLAWRAARSPAAPSAREAPMLPVLAARAARSSQASGAG